MTVETSGLGVSAGASLSCVAGPTSATTKTYQWLRNGVAIAGASASTYMTGTEDEGKVVQCQVFAINANAGSTQVSAARAVVSPAPATAPPVASAGIEKPAIATGRADGRRAGRRERCRVPRAPGRAPRRSPISGIATVSRYRVMARTRACTQCRAPILRPRRCFSAPSRVLMGVVASRASAPTWRQNRSRPRRPLRPRRRR